MGQLSRLIGTDVTTQRVDIICDTCGDPGIGYIISRKGVQAHKTTTCKSCSYKQALEDSNKADELDRQNLVQVARAEKRLSCGIPGKFQNVRFDGFDRKRPGNVGKVCQACIKYADNYNLQDPRGYKSLILTSARIWGNGKTMLSCSILHRILDRWNGERGSCSVLYITEYGMFERIQRTYNRDKQLGQETEDMVFNLLTTVGLLVVDDVGKVARSDPRFVQSTWFKIIDKRYAAELPIVLTCNLNPGEFFNHFGGQANEAAYSRLMDMAKDNSFEIDSPSYRNIKEMPVGQ